jgi:outer membrane protein assembly factor BamE (lipoprotein component of BamABCDE complex)
MKLEHSNKKRTALMLISVLFVAALMLANGSDAFGQTDLVALKQAPAQAAPVEPKITELRGISIGMTADEVREILGKPKLTEDLSLYYEFRDGESMQIALDADKKVKMAAMIYMGKKAESPAYEQVFGSTVELKEQADGRIYNLVRYPNAGVWVAYSRVLVEDEPMTIVTIKAIN